MLHDSKLVHVVVMPGLCINKIFVFIGLYMYLVFFPSSLLSWMFQHSYTETSVALVSSSSSSEFPARSLGFTIFGEIFVYVIVSDLTTLVSYILNVRVLHFGINTCSVQLSTFHIERYCRNKITVITIIRVA